MLITLSARGILAVEDNKPDCIEKLKELVKDEPRISVKELKTKGKSHHRTAGHNLDRLLLKASRLLHQFMVICSNIKSMRKLLLAKKKK